MSETAANPTNSRLQAAIAELRAAAETASATGAGGPSPLVPAEHGHPDAQLGGRMRWIKVSRRSRAE